MKIMGFSDEDFCKNAPWRDRDKKVTVRVEQTLVCDFEMNVPEFMPDDEITELATQVRLTPARAVKIMGDEDWFLEKESAKII